MKKLIFLLAVMTAVIAIAVKPDNDVYDLEDFTYSGEIAIEPKYENKYLQKYLGGYKAYFIIDDLLLQIPSKSIKGEILFDDYDVKFFESEFSVTQSVSNWKNGSTHIEFKIGDIDTNHLIEVKEGESVLMYEIVIFMLKDGGYALLEKEGMEDLIKDIEAEDYFEAPGHLPSEVQEELVRVLTKVKHRNNKLSRVTP